MTKLIALKLAQLLDATRGRAGFLIELIVGRAQGNPFYIEELLNYVHAQGIDPPTRAPPLARAPRQPAQPHPQPYRRAHGGPAAHAQGRQRRRPRFERPILPGVYPELGTTTSSRHLGMLRPRPRHAPTARTTSRTSSSTPSRKRSPTRACLSRSASSLHGHSRASSRRRAGRDRPEPRPARLSLLAQRRRGPGSACYLDRAGDAAQAAYANAAAIDYFERLAPLLDDADRPAILLKLGKVLELVGNWKRAEDVEHEALALAGRRRRGGGGGARRRSPR